jgi:hypothetical protein
MTYKEQLQHPKWQRKRLKALEKDNFTCTLCGDTETTLHVHHKEYKGKAWEADDDMLETHCEHCHLLVEEFKTIENRPNEKLKRVIKLTSDNNVEFIILIAVFYYEERNVDMYYFFDYYPKSKKLEYQYICNSTFLNELISKING